MSAADSPSIHVALSAEPIDPIALMHGWQRDDCGGAVTFIGTVRSPSQGRDVDCLIYEAYERLAVPQMQAIAEQVSTTHEVRAVTVVHRIGRVRVGEPAVVVAAAAPHRAAAFAAAETLIDRVKAEVAIWKDEVLVPPRRRIDVARGGPASDQGGQPTSAAGGHLG